MCVDGRPASFPKHKEKIMRNTFKAALLSIVLVFGLAGSAYAGPHHGGHYRHHRHNNWNNVAAAVVVTGLIGAAIAQSYQPPVVVAPPPAVSYPGTWYYCASARLYYPQVGYCPEGWRIVQQ